MLVCPLAAAHAQTVPGDLEVAVGVRRTGAMSLGSADATETTGGGGSFRLFASESRLEGANGLEGRLGFRLSETVHAEAIGSYGTSDLGTRLSSDVEGIPDVTATEPIQQYTIEGALVMDLPRWRIGTRVLPFVSAGGGYARYRHEGRTLVEDGGLWHLGGGVNIVLASRPDAAMKAIGLRADARVLFRVRGVAFDDDSHAVPAFGASAFLRF